MFTNYFKIAYRGLVRNRLYSAISILGLSIGISCCLLICLYVQDELSFDRFHSNADDIFRVIQFESGVNELTEGTNALSALMQPELKSTFPEIELAARVFGTQSVVYSDNESYTQTVVLVDPEFFSIFSFPLIEGRSETVIDDPGSVVLTPEMARKFFGDVDPLGQSLPIQLDDTRREFMVSGLIEEAPTSSSIQYDMLISTENLKYTVPESYLETWDIILFPTFVLLKEDTDIDALCQRMSDHVGDLSGYTEDGIELTYQLQPLTNIHLNPDLDGEMVASSDPIYSLVLSAIALGVLLIACINFMTLAIGRSSSRAREAGLRKVFGARRGQLMRQFWGEALLLSICALAIGIMLAEALLPTFNDLSQKQLTLSSIIDLKLLVMLVVLTVITAFVAGIYPAFLLSKRTPVDAMKGEIYRGSKNRIVQGMIVLQFAISVFLITGTLIMTSQMDHVANANLGYDKEHVVLFPTGTQGEAAADLCDRFRAGIADQPQVIDVTGYSFRFGQSWLYMSLTDEGRTVLIGEDITGQGYSAGLPDDASYFYINWVDPHYIPTMGIKLVDGRNFSDSHPSDVRGSIIINQTAAKAMGLDNPIGQKLPRGFEEAAIIGVVEDFHYYPLQREIEPLVLHMPMNINITSISDIGVRIRGENMPETISKLEEVWTNVSSGMPFSYEFLDDELAEQYAAEQRWKRIIEYSSILSVLITCLGLFGLTSLAVAKRTREVGIRKVLGASAPRLVTMFMRGFAGLILIANIIAWPIAYFVMNDWLKHFAYRTGIGIHIFVLTGGLVLLVAMLTIIYQATRAALANPVEAIKHE